MRQKKCTWKNILLLKNPQFSPNHYETLPKWCPHEYLILTKFRNDWVKIVDFLTKAYFFMCTFFASHLNFSNDVFHFLFPFFLGFLHMQKQQQQQGQIQVMSDMSKFCSSLSRKSCSCSFNLWHLLSSLRSCTASNHICLAMSVSVSVVRSSFSSGRGWFPT